MTLPSTKPKKTEYRSTSVTPAENLPQSRNKNDNRMANSTANVFNQSNLVSSMRSFVMAPSSDAFIKSDVSTSDNKGHTVAED